MSAYALNLFFTLPARALDCCRPWQLANIYIYIYIPSNTNNVCTDTMWNINSVAWQMLIRSCAFPPICVLAVYSHALKCMPPDSQLCMFAQIFPCAHTHTHTCAFARPPLGRACISSHRVYDMRANNLLFSVCLLRIYTQDFLYICPASINKFSLETPTQNKT